MNNFFLQNELFDRPLFWVAVLWTLVWKGIALWKSAQRREKWWFIFFLIVNTLGILEIFYIFIWTTRKKFNGKVKVTKSKKSDGDNIA